jgi:hypothetical protein
VIRKIDKETRNRFKDTFDQINGGLQALFPKVFGGGSAYLELTGEDLLDTGVTIMARPPGKKNSTIHLLSGGEKALTALALVFAIFKLNPAPFCMLDEVDAPLDDANVGRYATGQRDVADRAVHLYHPQQDRHGNGRSTDGGDDARAGLFASGGSGCRGGDGDGGRLSQRKYFSCRTFYRFELANRHIAQAIVTDGVKLSLVVLV